MVYWLDVRGTARLSHLTCVTQALGSHPAVPGVQTSALTPGSEPCTGNVAVPPELHSLIFFPLSPKRFFLFYFFFFLIIFFVEIWLQSFVFSESAPKMLGTLRQSITSLLPCKIPVGRGGGTQPGPLCCTYQPLGWPCRILLSPCNKRWQVVCREWKNVFHY